MPIRNEKDFTSDKGSNRIIAIGKGILLAYVISIICLVIYGLLLNFTKMSENSMPTVIMVITVISIAVAGVHAAVNAESKGWLNGAGVGLVYMVILFLLSLLLDKGAVFDRLVLFRIFMGFIIGTLAGIIGINLK